MDINEFFIFLERTIKADKQAFINNMRLLDIHDKSFCEWISLYIRWMEWYTDYDCKHFYGAE